MRSTAIAKSALQRLKSMMQKSLRAVSPSPRRPSLIPGAERHLLKWVSWLALPLVALASPAWALTLVARPDLATLKRAQVLRVVNSNTLAVQLEGELQWRLVRLIGIDPLPEINPNWTEIRQETPLAVYNASQYLQTALLGREVLLELDAALDPSGILPVYVWQADTLINQEMLFLGHAQLSASTEGLKYGTILTEAAEAAKQQGRGYWTPYGPR